MFVPPAKPGLSAPRSAGRSSAIGTPPHSTTAPLPRITMTSVSHTVLFSLVPGFMVTSGDRAGRFQGFDTLPLQAQLHQEGLSMLGRLRRARGFDRFVIELHWAAHQLQ